MWKYRCSANAYSSFRTMSQAIIDIYRQLIHESLASAFVPLVFAAPPTPQGS